jgi:hypothetical protein
VSGQRIGDSGEALPQFRDILKIQSEAAYLPDTLGDVSGSDIPGEIERISRHCIEG